jgi:hypothetical protein
MSWPFICGSSVDLSSVVTQEHSTLSWPFKKEETFHYSNSTLVSNVLGDYSSLGTVFEFSTLKSVRIWQECRSDPVIFFIQYTGEDTETTSWVEDNDVVTGFSSSSCSWHDTDPSVYHVFIEDFFTLVVFSIYIRTVTTVLYTRLRPIMLITRFWILFALFLITHSRW